ISRMVKGLRLKLNSFIIGVLVDRPPTIKSRGRFRKIRAGLRLPRGGRDGRWQKLAVHFCIMRETGADGRAWSCTRSRGEFDTHLSVKTPQDALVPVRIRASAGRVPAPDCADGIARPKRYGWRADRGPAATAAIMQLVELSSRYAWPVIL